MLGVSEVRQPSVTIDYGGCAVNPTTFRCYVKVVQSYILSAGYANRYLFTAQTLNSVLHAVENTGIFFVSPCFNLWDSFCGSAYGSLMERFGCLHGQFIKVQRKATETQYVE